MIVGVNEHILMEDGFIFLKVSAEVAECIGELF